MNPFVKSLQTASLSLALMPLFLGTQKSFGADATNPAAPPDVHMGKQDARIHFAVGIDAHVRREHAVAHGAAGDDAAHRDQRVVCLAGAAWIVFISVMSKFGVMLATLTLVSLVCTYLLPETNGTTLRSTRAG